MKQYLIRRAKKEDMPAIEKIYASARVFMAENGNPNQWGKTNPPVSQLWQDIAEGILYVITEDGIIHGVFVFFVGEDLTYRELYEGSWHRDAPYGVIHRVAGDGSGGIFAACVEYCRKQCDYLRIDTHYDNRPMQHVIEKAGFRRRGIIYIADGSPRIAYDRIDAETADII